MTTEDPPRMDNSQHGSSQVSDLMAEWAYMLDILVLMHRLRADARIVLLLV